MLIFSALIAVHNLSKNRQFSLRKMFKNHNTGPGVQTPKQRILKNNFHSTQFLSSSLYTIRIKSSKLIFPSWGKFHKTFQFVKCLLSTCGSFFSSFCQTNKFGKLLRHIVYLCICLGTGKFHSSTKVNVCNVFVLTKNFALENFIITVKIGR
jgi:hypothetical protein